MTTHIVVEMEEHDDYDMEGGYVTYVDVNEREAFGPMTKEEAEAFVKTNQRYTYKREWRGQTVDSPCYRDFRIIELKSASAFVQHSGS